MGGFYIKQNEYVQVPIEEFREFIREKFSLDGVIDNLY